MADFKYTAGGFSSIILSNTLGAAHLASVVNDLLISPAGTERMRITSAGNVGIGTTSPSEKLHVVGNGLFTGGVYVNGNSAFLWNQSNGVIRFGTNNAERARIDANGNFGINTTSPAYILDVNGSINTTEFNINSINQVTGLAYMEPIVASGFWSRTSATDEWVKVISVDGTPRRIRLVLFAGGDNTNSYEEYMISHSGYGMQTHIHRLPGSRYNTSKVVGIKVINPTGPTQEVWVKLLGMTTPPGDFTYRSNVAVLSSAAVAASSQSAEPTSTTGSSVLLFDSTDRNIYTTMSSGGAMFNNDVKLNHGGRIYGNGTNAALLLNNASGSFLEYSTSNRVGVGSGVVTISTAGSERVRVDSSGNVGIGTTSPTHKLHVVGSVNIEDDLTFGIGGFLGTSSSVFEMFSLGDIIYNADSNNNGNNNHIFRESGNELMRITSAGNVGIGTTNPAAKLQVISSTSSLTDYGIATFESSDAKGLSFGYDGGSDWVWIYSRHVGVSGKPIRINNNLFIQSGSTGSVGIGTTSPASKLHVSSPGTFGTQTIVATLSSDTARPVLQFSESSAGGIESGMSIEYDGQGSGVSNKIYINNVTGSPVFTVTSGGNVGIGTTSPTQKLDVVGNIKLSNNSSLIWRNAANNADISILQLTSTNDLNIGTTSSSVPSTIRLHTSNTERMRIDASGNVGIGTTSPNGHMLDIASTQGNVNNSAIRALFPAGGGLLNTEFGALAYRGGVWTAVYGKQGAASSAAYFDGNVGIGTPSPSAKLEVVGDNTDGQIIIARASNPDQKLFLRSGIGSGEGRVASNYSLELRAGLSGGNAHDLTLSTSSGEALRVDATNNNIGIGTTSPSYKLEVVGTAAFTGSRSVFYDVGGGNFQIKASTGGWATGYFFQGSSGTYRGGWGGWGNDDTLGYLWAGDAFNTPTLIVQGGQGNVGIGNTAPSQKLHVTGNVRVTGAYYDSNNQAGTSGQVLTSTGTGTDWKSLSEITGVDGTGTANYVAKWSDTDTITNSQIQDNGTTVGIGQAPGPAKLTVNGSAQLGSRAIYVKSYASLDTTGVAVAGLITSTNGDSSLFEFTCNGGAGQYQRIVYACHNTTGTWNARKVIDEGTNELDVVASASAATITFTFKARTTGQGFTPRVTVEVTGSRDVSYL
jgi:hypothetical protein